MSHRSILLLAAVVGLSLAVDAVVAGWFLFGKSTPVAVGQTAAGANDYLMGTEKMSDQSPICFVLSQKNPAHLMTYRVDGRGMLIFMDGRDISWDAQVTDSHFGADGRGKGTRTLPSVQDVMEAVKKGQAGATGGKNGGGAGGTKAEEPGAGSGAKTLPDDDKK